MKYIGAFPVATANNRYWLQVIISELQVYPDYGKWRCNWLVELYIFKEAVMHHMEEKEIINGLEQRIQSLERAIFIWRLGIEVEHNDNGEDMEAILAIIEGQLDQMKNELYGLKDYYSRNDLL